MTSLFQYQQRSCHWGGRFQPSYWQSGAICWLHEIVFKIATPYCCQVWNLMLLSCNPQHVVNKEEALREGIHRENTTVWLSWPRFHAPLYNFTPPARSVTHHWTRLQHQMHFCAILLLLVLEIRFNFQIDLQCAEKFTFNIQWNLKQIWRSWHTWVSKGNNIKGFKNNGVWVAR